MALAAPVSRHDGSRGGAGRDAGHIAARHKVLILSVGVDGGHQALDDAELIVEHEANGAGGFVVHDVGMMFWLPLYLSSLTPRTMMSSSVAGAE